MLRIKGGLLWYLLRHVLSDTLFALLAACLYVLLWHDVLGWRDGWPWVFMVIHARLPAARFSHFGQGSFAFLYGRGFSRDAIWGHVMLASFLSVLTVWAPAAIIVWTPLRGIVQDVLHSPFFPIMAPREATVPLLWLLGYCILIPLLHYEWIRRAQPVRGGEGGTLLAVGVVVAIATLLIVGFYRPWFTWLCTVAGVLIVGAALVGSWRLHRRLEVRV